MDRFSTRLDRLPLHPKDKTDILAETMRRFDKAYGRPPYEPAEAAEAVPETVEEEKPGLKLVLPPDYVPEETTPAMEEIRRGTFVPRKLGEATAAPFETVQRAAEYYGERGVPETLPSEQRRAMGRSWGYAARIAAEIAPFGIGAAPRSAAALGTWGARALEFGRPGVAARAVPEAIPFVTRAPLAEGGRAITPKAMPLIAPERVAARAMPEAAERIPSEALTYLYSGVPGREAVEAGKKAVKAIEEFPAKAEAAMTERILGGEITPLRAPEPLRAARAEAGERAGAKGIARGNYLTFHAEDVKTAGKLRRPEVLSKEAADVAPDVAKEAAAAQADKTVSKIPAVERVPLIQQRAEVIVQNLARERVRRGDKGDIHRWAEKNLLAAINETTGWSVMGKPVRSLADERITYRILARAEGSVMSSFRMGAPSYVDPAQLRGLAGLKRLFARATLRALRDTDEALRIFKNRVVGGLSKQERIRAHELLQEQNVAFHEGMETGLQGQGLIRSVVDRSEDFIRRHGLSGKEIEASEAIKDFYRDFAFLFEEPEKFYAPRVWKSLGDVDYRMPYTPFEHRGMATADYIKDPLEAAQESIPLYYRRLHIQPAFPKGLRWIRQNTKGDPRLRAIAVSMAEAFRGVPPPAVQRVRRFMTRVHDYLALSDDPSMRFAAKVLPPLMEKFGDVLTTGVYMRYLGFRPMSFLVNMMDSATTFTELSPKYWLAGQKDLGNFLAGTQEGMRLRQIAEVSGLKAFLTRTRTKELQEQMGRLGRAVETYKTLSGLPMAASEKVVGYAAFFSKMREQMSKLAPRAKQPITFDNLLQQPRWIQEKIFSEAALFRDRTGFIGFRWTEPELLRTIKSIPALRRFTPFLRFYYRHKLWLLSKVSEKEAIPLARWMAFYNLVGASLEAAGIDPTYVAGKRVAERGPYIPPEAAELGLLFGGREGFTPPTGRLMGLGWEALVRDREDEKKAKQALERFLAEASLTMTGGWLGLQKWADYFTRTEAMEKEGVVYRTRPSPLGVPQIEKGIVRLPEQLTTGERILSYAGFPLMKVRRAREELQKARREAREKDPFIRIPAKIKAKELAPPEEPKTLW